VEIITNIDGPDRLLGLRIPYQTSILHFPTANFLKKSDIQNPLPRWNTARAWSIARPMIL
jgi:hypothetical protein